MVGRQLPLFKPSKRGRPRKKGAISHVRRPVLGSRLPVHVTMRVLGDVANLRGRDSYRALARAFRQGRAKLGFWMVGYSVQGNHIHFLVEGADAQALSRGMQGLNIRMARRLNGATGRTGKVFADRYHAHVLRTPTEVARARAYVLRNNAHHFEQTYGYRLPDHIVDPLTDLNYQRPQTWLLREGYRRARIESS